MLKSSNWWKFIRPIGEKTPLIQGGYLLLYKPFRVLKIGINISKYSNVNSNQNQLMNSVAINNLSDEHIVMFFRKLKSELNCSSTLKIIEQVRLTLSRVKNFSAPDIAHKIPPLFHMMLANTRFACSENKINHLDELADSLYKEDRQAGKKLFKSEIDALGTAIVILKRTQELLTRAGIQAFPYVLSTELMQAVIEEAA